MPRSIAFRERRVCKKCRSPFVAAYRNSYFCSRKCGMHFYRRKWRQRNPDAGKHPRKSREVLIKTCPQCGNNFNTVNSNRKWCSDKCRCAHFVKLKPRRRNIENANVTERRRTDPEYRDRARREAKAYYRKNRDKCRQRQAAFRLNHLDKVKEREKYYRKKYAAKIAEYLHRNRGGINARRRRYYADNPGKKAKELRDLRQKQFFHNLNRLALSAQEKLNGHDSSSIRVSDG